MSHLAANFWSDGGAASIPTKRKRLKSIVSEFEAAAWGDSGDYGVTVIRGNKSGTAPVFSSMPPHMVGVWNRKGAWRGVALALTAFALVLKVMVPPGFMLADSPQPFLITVCTGHGPLVLDLGDTKAPPHKQMNVPCSGADNVAPPAPPLLGVLAEPFAWAAVVRSAGPAVAVAPGRGLAAPPPPSQGPPITLS